MTTIWAGLRVLGEIFPSKQRSLKSEQQQMITNDDNDRIPICLWFSEAASSTLSFFKPMLEFHWGNACRSPKLLDGQPLFPDQLIDLRSAQVEGFGDLGNGPQ
jgi:hypothetical protein